MRAGAGNRLKLWSEGRPNHPAVFRWVVLIALLVSAISLGAALLRLGGEGQPSPAAFEGDILATVAILDVGQALSAAVVTSDGASLVYDFGLTSADTEETILPFLHEHDITSLDYAVLSHPHQDHVAGLPALLETIQVELYIDPVLETSNQTYLRSLEIIEEDGIPAAIARRGDEYPLGSNATFEILWPTDDLLSAGDGTPLLNENSTVVKLHLGSVHVLLTGDIETNAEATLVAEYAGDLDVDILQVAHHGSNTSSQDAFLEAAGPEVAIIPVGADNQHGHPHREVVQRLRAHEISIYRTDVDGTVVVETDGTSYRVTTTGSDNQ